MCIGNLQRTETIHWAIGKIMSINNCKLLLLILLINVWGCSNPSQHVNHPPVINSVTASPPSITTSEKSTLSCVATDEDLDSLMYSWSYTYGTLTNTSTPITEWRAPDYPGVFTCFVVVSDGGEAVDDSISIEVKYPNRSPLRPYNPQPSHGATNVSITPTLTWECSDPDGDPITYDILFGKLNYTELIILDHPMTSFSPDTLERGQYYGWYIRAKDDHGNYSVSPQGTWTFSTEQ